MPSTKAAKRTKTSAAPKAARSRTSATEKHFIPNYPKKLFIYKLPASPYWWARYFVNGNAVRKSTAFGQSCITVLLLRSVEIGGITEGNVIRIISARKASAHESKQYR